MKQIKRNNIKIDAKGQALGRLATQVANLLRGKDKVSFVPNVDVGDFVTIYNFEDIKFTGRKLEQKKYATHSGYAGGLKIRSLKEIKDKNPNFILIHAVKGMLPKNKLQNNWLKRLKIYSGEINGQEK